MRATNILILLCFIASLYAWYLGGSNPKLVEDNLAFSLRNLEAGRIWTLVTGIFVHANLIHLLGNMIFLHVFGNTLESISNNSKRMLFSFFLGGLLAFLLSIPFFPPDTIFMGASAAIFTLTAVVMLMKPLRWSWLLLMPVGGGGALLSVQRSCGVLSISEQRRIHLAHHWFPTRISTDDCNR